MKEDELNILKKLLDSLVDSSTKSNAQPLYNQLNNIAEDLTDRIKPNELTKLQEIIDLAKEASGQVSHKEQFRSNMKQRWTVFKRQVLT